MKHVASILALFSCLAFGGLAEAQAVAVDYTKAKASWNEDVTAGVGIPTAFTLKCGTAAGGSYSMTKAYPVTPPLTTAGGQVPLSDLVTTSGTYFCVVSAKNLIGESANSTEVTFQAGRIPPVPTGLAIVP